MQGVALTDEQLRMAAEARYMGRASWEETAKAAGCVSATIRQYEYDADPRWLAAIEAVVKIMRQRGLPVAYTCLLEQAEGGDVAAAKALLDRCEGAVSQTLGLHGVAGEPPVAVTHGFDASTFDGNPAARAAAFALADALTGGAQPTAATGGGVSAGTSASDDGTDAATAAPGPD